MTEAPSLKEWIAILLARDLVDGEWGIAPVADVTIAACLLAQATHAPNLTFLTAGGAVNPKPRYLSPSGADWEYLATAEAISDFDHVFEYSERGVDFMFLSGIQVDRFGNVNLYGVGGTPGRPAFRGPGLANISHGVTCRRLLLYKLTHTPRDFVERVDFISAPGWIDGPAGRHRAGIETPGPRSCLTPLCSFDLPPETGTMRLRSLHPGVTADQAAAATGFAFDGADQATTTPLPSETELTILRDQIDPRGQLRASL